MKHLSGVPLRGLLLAKPTNIIVWWNNLTGTNTLAYRAHSQVTKKNNCCEYGFWLAANLAKNAYHFTSKSSEPIFVEKLCQHLIQALCMCMLRSVWLIVLPRLRFEVGLFNIKVDLKQHTKV